MVFGRTDKSRQLATLKHKPTLPTFSTSASAVLSAPAPFSKMGRPSLSRPSSGSGCRLCVNSRCPLPQPHRRAGRIGGQAPSPVPSSFTFGKPFTEQRLRERPWFAKRVWVAASFCPIYYIDNLAESSAADSAILFGHGAKPEKKRQRKRVPQELVID